MQPFVLYLAASDLARNHGTGERTPQPLYAPSDALPLTEPAQVSHLGRLATIVRRRITSATRPDSRTTTDPSRGAA